MEDHQDQDTSAQPEPDGQHHEESASVSILVRGGYPIEPENLFALTTRLASDRLAKGVPTTTPASMEDRPVMLELMDDLFLHFPDLDCSVVANPAVPRKWTYFIATDQGRYVSIPCGEYRDMVRTQDFWNPAVELHLQETIADLEIRDLLTTKIGAKLHPFRTVFWD
ncbi:uncharacterized protein SCHCODRAFT_02571568 [Schizophyllum commune H4-8]|uniref:uncharacterized protein n=1 Tax=Schizophyllum commune (strain H4-8 / FGSC 9210) TaxID=578458 RepID=UPI0021606C23|nr:uncharacterized protein SCHCODRAFT_02571568 [Schizophyllum commune H4-8]KAI5894778.1 hypothetical protein SCHCODRAFT_02571568 [Schizophyllum commune H4-8]